MALTVAELFSDFLVKNGAERTEGPRMENRESHARFRTSQRKKKSHKADEGASFCYLLNKEITKTCRTIIRQHIKMFKSE